MGSKCACCGDKKKETNNMNINAAEVPTGENVDLDSKITLILLFKTQNDLLMLHCLKSIENIKVENTLMRELYNDDAKNALNEDTTDQKGGNDLNNSPEGPNFGTSQEST
jgi:hypothetical protein